MVSGTAQQGNGEDGGDSSRRGHRKGRGAMKPVKEKHILLVDDEEPVRLALGAVLRREGYCVHLAEGGEEGLRILKEQPVQLVISDYSMPQMTGVEFLKLVRERYPHALRI